MLSWDISADWQYDPTLKTEIEVRFSADGSDHTRVELEDRHLDRYGARRDEMRRIFDTEGDWGKPLEAFARAAAGRKEVPCRIPDRREKRWFGEYWKDPAKRHLPSAGRRSTTAASPD